MLKFFKISLSNVGTGKMLKLIQGSFEEQSIYRQFNEIMLELVRYKTG